MQNITLKENDNNYMFLIKKILLQVQGFDLVLKSADDECWRMLGKDVLV